MKKLLAISFFVFLSVVCLMGINGRDTANAQTSSDSRGFFAAQSGVDLIAEDIVVRKIRDMNFRVRVKNVGTHTARGMKGNLLVSLSVRDKNSGEWILLKTWKNIDKIMPGQRVSRDYFATELADPNLRENTFTLKADISFMTPKGIRISKESIVKSYPQDAIDNP